MKNLFIQGLQSHAPLNIAHRGAKSHAPENTLAAFERAIEHGADGVEFDIRLCKSGDWVVFHDIRLNRTTNGRGYVRRKALDEIRSLDAGIKFGEKFRQELVPTLSDVLEMAQDRLFLNIEVKSTSAVRERHVARLITLIYRHHKEERCIISSFNPFVLHQLSRLAPQLPTGLILTGDLFTRKAGSPLKRLADIKSLHVPAKILSPRFVQKVRKLDLHLLVWGANTPEAFAELIQYNVDGIITDEPLELSKLLGSSNEI